MAERPAGTRARSGLIRTLADGAVHSEASLRAGLGLTAAQLARALEALPELGLEPQRLAEGWRLTEALNLLEPSRIMAGLEPGDRAAIADLSVLEQTDSTSSALRRREGAARGALVCLAEHQRAGRGRGRRRWVSPYAQGLCLSLRWTLERGGLALSGLSLALGVAVKRALSDLGFSGIGLKWPNDLLARGRKLGGVLIETFGGAPCVVVAGIGLNWRVPAAQGVAIGQPWIDLAALAPDGPPERNRLAAGLIHHALAAQREFAGAGLAPFVDEWHAADAFAGREVLIDEGRERIRGRSLGIGPDGRLRLATPSGERAVAAGEVRIARR